MTVRFASDGSFIVCFSMSPLILPVSDVTVGVQQVSYSVREVDGLVMVCAILTGDTQKEVLVNLTTLSGSAQGQLESCICTYACIPPVTWKQMLNVYVFYHVLQLGMTSLKQSYH